MSQENQSCLRFSLEESLWFRKGQEVTELVSISLDPDITIQENDQYVTIRGSLELSGEYVCNNENSEEEEGSNPGHKYVQIVQDRESGTCQFSHRFPVDITIPNNRIKSIYDIDVVVESFDYSFPERSCMKLTSDLTISGLYGEQQHEREEEKVEELARGQEEQVAEEQEAFEEETALVHEDETYPALEEEEEDTFQAEARKQVTEEAPVEVTEIPSFAYQALRENFHQDFLAQFARGEEKQEPEAARSEVKQEPEVARREVKQEPEVARREVKQEPEVARREVKQGPEVARREVKQEPEVARSEVKQEVVVQEQAQPEMVTVIEEETVKAELEPESSSSPQMVQEPEPKKKKQGKKKSMSLTEFFARREGTNDSAKLKVCIVQKGDTLNLLSERYDIPVQSLVRVNHLEINHDVYEGQVLYIPVTVAKK